MGKDPIAVVKKKSQLSLHKSIRNKFSNSMVELLYQPTNALP